LVTYQDGSSAQRQVTHPSTNPLIIEQLDQTQWITATLLHQPTRFTCSHGPTWLQLCIHFATVIPR